MPPATYPTQTFTVSDDMRTALINALTRAFLDGPAIGNALQDGQEALVDIINVNAGRSEVASAAVRKAIADTQVPRLLILAQSGAPMNQPLRDVARRIDPTLVLPLGPSKPQTIAWSIDQGVDCLASHADDPQVQSTLRAVADPLKSADMGITRLVRYKALHDGLHSIPYRLETIAAAASLLSKSGTTGKQAADELTVYAADLGRVVDQARQDVAGLPEDDQDREGGWIDVLQQRARQLRQAAKGEDSAPALAAVEAIGSLQRQQSPFINWLLVQAAGTLPLRTLSNVLDLLVPVLTRIQKPDAAVPFQQARRKLLDVERDFETAVQTHKDWQRIDRHLSLEEHTAGPDLSMILLPQRMRCAETLRRLVAREPTVAWAITTANDLPLWLRAEEDEDEPTAATAFQNLRSACRDQFNAVDKQLLAMCGRLDVITKPLGRLRTLANQ